MIYTGTRKPMDIDWSDMMKRGLCFKCKKQGHVQKDCSKKRQQVRQTSEDTKEDKNEKKESDF